MVCPSSVVAHLAKFIVTIACMITLRDPFGKTSPWSFRAFQILLLHSILGILRFGKEPFVTFSHLCILRLHISLVYTFETSLSLQSPLKVFTFYKSLGLAQKISCRETASGYCTLSRKF